MALTKITPQMFDTSAAGHDFNIDNGTFVVDASANRVGIGTATPSTLLDVDGTATATTFVGALTGNVTGNVTGTILTAAQTNITSLGTLTALTVDDITINGSTISDAADLLLDVGGDISLDADGGDIRLLDGGTQFGKFTRDGGDFLISSSENDKDIKFAGADGGANITALTLDMSEAGAATFNSAVATGGNLTVNGNTNLTGNLTVDSTTLYVDSSNNKVGIGTTSPSSQDGSGNNLVIEDSAGNGGLTIKTPTNAIGGIHFSDGTSGADRYRGIISYSHSENSMRFHTDTARAMTIDSNGSVGIGTTATDPYSLGSTGKTLSINSSNANTGALISLESADANRGYLFANAFNVVLSAVHTDIPLKFNTNNTTKMTIEGSSGSVGIGTVSPSFTAVSGSSSQKGLHIQNSGNDTSAHLKLTGHNNTGTPGQATDFEIIHRGDALQTIFRHGGADVLTIDSSGNITFSGTLNGITTTKSVSGNRWGVLPEVASNGVLEIGRYIDFHVTDGDTSDYGARFDYDGSKMILTSAMQIEGAATLNNNVTVAGDVTISDANDRLIMNGVAREAKGGYIQGNQTVSYTINHTSQSTFHVRCGFNHYGLLSYGCVLDQIYANGPGGMTSATATIQSTTGPGGGWSLTRVDSTNVTITKSAGNYAGGGYYYIIVEGANL